VTPAPPTSTPPAGEAGPAPRPRRRWRRIAIDLLVVAAVLTGAGLWQTRRHLPSGTAPEIALPALDGAEVSLPALRGKPVMVALWAPWCGVCKAQSDNVSRTMRWLGGRAHVVSIVAAHGSVEEVRAAVREQGIDYPVLLGDDRLLGTLGVTAFPTIYFLDAEGRVKRTAAGYTTTLGMLARTLF
jgi:thiol-disulfide isomerase/thioredoxin